MRIYNRTRYLTLLRAEKYDTIYDKIRYLISLKSGITFFLTILPKSKLNLIILCYKKRLNLNNVIILIKSVLNKDKNQYDYNIFLEKCSYQLTKI